MTKRILTLFILSTFYSLSHAQSDDSTHYYLQLTSTNSFNKTDDENAYLLSNGLHFSMEKKRVKLNFSNDWLYGHQSGSKTNNDFSSTLDINLYKNDSHFFYWGLANYNTSYSLKINDQLMVGAGIAHIFFDTDGAYLNLSDGFLFDTSTIIEHDLPVNDQTIRNSLRLAYKFVVKEMIVFQGSNFYQPSLLSVSDFNIKLNNDVAFKLNRWLSLEASLIYNRINRTDRENLLFTYGMAIERHF